MKPRKIENWKTLYAELKRLQRQLYGIYLFFFLWLLDYYKRLYFFAKSLKNTI